MFHQGSNSFLFVGLLFWFPVMNGQNNLRRVGYSETWKFLLIAGDDTGKNASLVYSTLTAMGKSGPQFTWTDIAYMEKGIEGDVQQNN